MNQFAISITLVAVILCGCSTSDKKSPPLSSKKQIARLDRSSAQTVSKANAPSAPSITPKPADKPAIKPAATVSKKSVTTENFIGGKVAAFNSAGRFVVLDFSAGKMPALEQTMFVYRDEQKIGEVKVSGPTHDNNTVADLVFGEARKGDEVRER